MTDPKPPRRNRPGQGRPAPDEPRPRRGPLRIEQSLWDAAAALSPGGKNATEGIRRAIRDATRLRAALGQIIDWRGDCVDHPTSIGNHQPEVIIMKFHRDDGTVCDPIRDKRPEPDCSSSIDPAQVERYRAFVSRIKAVIDGYEAPEDGKAALAELLIRDAINNGTHGSPGERVAGIATMIGEMAIEYLDADDPWVVRVAADGDSQATGSR